MFGMCRLPSVLTYTNSFMQKRLDFLRDSGLPLEAIAKAVVSHPQVSVAPIMCKASRIRLCALLCTHFMHVHQAFCGAFSPMAISSSNHMEQACREMNLRFATLI